jgi:hypothetical protein
MGSAFSSMISSRGDLSTPVDESHRADAIYACEYSSAPTIANRRERDDIKPGEAQIFTKKEG